MYLTTLNKLYKQNFEAIVKSISNSTLNVSMIDECINLNATLVKQLSAAQFMGMDCTKDLVRNAPVTRQVVDRFMNIFSTFVMQPIADLTTCNTALEKEFCVTNFENRHFQPNMGPNRNGISQMLEMMSKTAFNNADYAIIRMEQCYEYAGKVYSRVLAEITKLISNCVLKKSTS
ncbi:uncharacterized protein LOC119766463 [Culex quinquefasciatus]|uniref:uncharacterized protein LOC119766463 n=1 Tax=Culex quinquefasciatus TaxID=7176 RepID=UPI0018E2DFFB|nr:uncharacterized protein LOC119766463 [Culex quinquefasciatus]